VVDALRAPRLDKVLFFTTLSLVVLVCIPLGLIPEQAEREVSAVYNWIASNLGVFYQLFAVVTIVYLIWLVCSPFGDIRLGADQPDFSTFSWAGMLFCAGTGASLLVWSGVEWAFYYDAPPYGATPRSAEAITWATAYGPFHWGVVAWCFYALPTIAISYPFYMKGVPRLRASTALHAILGPAGENSGLGRAVDLAVMIALLGGAGTSLGVIAPTIAATLAQLGDVESSFGLELVVMFVSIGLFAMSVYMGIEKGIKRLSDLNVYLALGLLAYILLAGPTLFILKTTTDTMGFMTGSFVRMLTWTDPVANTGFVESWTIFYWAWWIAFAAPIGIFVTRISRGRTIRQVVVSMVFFGTLGCWLFYFVLGNYSLWLELEGVLPVSTLLAENGMYDTAASIIASLPFSNLALAVFALVCIISVATTYDSASYTLASTSTVELREGDNPSRWLRLAFAAILGTLPIFMMFVGGLQIIRSGVLIASLPLLAVGVGMIVSLTRSLREHGRESGREPLPVSR
jgi:BCCT family betaine/carnitine transporter